MHRVGVCSWSLRPAGPEDLVRQLQACGVAAVQLALDPIREGRWAEPEVVDRFRAAGIRILSGMMGTVGEDYSTLDSIRTTGGLRPDQHWHANLQAAHDNAALARRLGLELVTFHAGFLPHDRGDAERAILLDRLASIADAFARQNINVAFETGQETAETLIEVLDDLAMPQVGVNFDPANLILYGMGNPVEALSRLTPRVRQLHIKDAIPTRAAGAWGEEVPVGSGSVDWSAFFKIVSRTLPEVDLVIEREAGEQRIEDIRSAHELIRRFVPCLPAKRD